MNEPTTIPDAPRKSRRGFAGMSLEKRRAIASRGGKAAHAKGVAHRFTSEQAAAAGRKGGTARWKKRVPEWLRKKVEEVRESC